MFQNIRKIFSSEFTNKNLSSDEIQDLVHKECIDAYEKKEILVAELPQLAELAGGDVLEPMEEPNQTLRDAAQRYRTMTAVPIFEQPEIPIIPIRG